MLEVFAELWLSHGLELLFMRHYPCFALTRERVHDCCPPIDPNVSPGPLRCRIRDQSLDAKPTWPHQSRTRPPAMGRPAPNPVDRGRDCSRRGTTPPARHGVHRQCGHGARQCRGVEPLPLARAPGRGAILPNLVRAPWILDRTVAERRVF